MKFLGGALLCACAASFLIPACKQSTENEIRKYAFNTESVNRQIVQFPAFKPMLANLLAGARMQWDSANAAGGSGEKIKAMMAVNGMFMDSPVSGGLNSFSTHTEKIKGYLRDLSENRDRKYAYTISRAITEGDRDLGDASDLILKALPKDDAEAAMIIKRANGILIAREGDLERLKKSLEPKKNATERKK